MAQIRLKNRIGKTALIGWVVKSHPTDKKAYILADTPDPDAIGTVAEQTVNNYWGLVNLLNTVNYNDVIATVRTITGDSTELLSDYGIVCDSSSPMNFYLLDATGGGRRREVINIGEGAVNIISAGDPSDPSLQDLIDGETSITINQWDVLTLKDLSVNFWKIIQSSGHVGLVSVSGSPPDNPTINDIWVDTSS